MSELMSVKCTNCNKEQVASIPIGSPKAETLKQLVCKHCGKSGHIQHIAFG